MDKLTLQKGWQRASLSASVLCFFLRVCSVVMLTRFLGIRSEV